MRLLALLCFIAIAIIASSLVSVSPAAAQAGVSDPSGGSKSSNQQAAQRSAHIAPQTLGDLELITSDLRLSFRFAFARYISIGDGRAMTSASPADLPARKRRF